MKNNDIKDMLTKKLKAAFKFVLTYKRYFSAAVILILIVVVLFACTGSNDSDSSLSGAYAQYTENSNEELSTLISDYYTAYAAGDTDTLQTLADPYCDQEISYIQFYSQYIDSFSNIEIYTKPGLDDDSYLVSAVVDLKFVDIDTVAPGCDFFYVQKNDDGKLYINNIYGGFNQTNSVYQMDTDVSNLIATFNQQEDVLAKEAEVQEAFDEALESDTALYDFINTTLTDAIVQWNTDYNASASSDDSGETADTDTSSTITDEENSNAYTASIIDKVNVRASADKESDKLGSLDAGSTVRILGEDGDFYKIDYSGKGAYIIKTSVQTADESESEESTDTEETSSETSSESSSASSVASGSEITLSSTVNIRSSMDTSSSKVAVAYAGEKVTVVMSYAEGWTKVKYGNKEGYIKTDLLSE